MLVSQVPHEVHLLTIKISHQIIQLLNFLGRMSFIVLLMTLEYFDLFQQFFLLLCEVLDLQVLSLFGIFKIRLALFKLYSQLIIFGFNLRIFFKFTYYNLDYIPLSLLQITYCSSSNLIIYLSLASSYTF